MSDTKKKVVEVIDVDYEDAPGSINAKHPAAQVPHRAASALEALADTVGVVAPEQAEVLRGRARQIRAVGKGLEATVAETRGLGKAVKEAIKKLGLDKMEFEQRIPLRRQAEYQAAQAAKAAKKAAEAAAGPKN